MQSYQKSIQSSTSISEIDPGFDPDLILLFVSPNFRNSEEYVRQIKNKYPDSTITGCSTSGEIYNTEVKDATIAFSNNRQSC